jgi:Glycosyltransferase Family 4
MRVLKEPRASSPGLVLITTDTVGGIWAYALDLARGLGRTGARTVLATMGSRPSEAQRAEAAAVPGLVLEESEFRLEWMPEVGDHLARAGDWLLDLERRHRPDVAHLNGFTHAALPWQAPRVVVAHSCVLSWWRAVKGEAPPAMWEGYARAVTEGLQAAEVVIAPTAACSADEVLAYLQHVLDDRRRAVGAAARERVLGAHTADHRAAELEAYLSEAAARPARGAGAPCLEHASP